jgi:hypothetical protein
MFIRFIETAVNKLPNVETGEFVNVETCLYYWQPVAANGDRAVV